MSPITTHILDTSRGCPAEGVSVSLLRIEGGGAQQLATAQTNADGRVEGLLQSGLLQKGVYQLRFDTAEYFAQLGSPTFYPAVSIDFRVESTDQHYHVPLLLSPFGYSTYRGS